MSGKKGRSGRKPKGYAVEHYNLTKLAEDTCYEALINKDLPLSDRVRVALPIAIKNQTSKTELTLIPAQDQALLARYDIPLPDNRLSLITGNTSNPNDSSSIDSIEPS
jgi:hypothetical protein